MNTYPRIASAIICAAVLTPVHIVAQHCANGLHVEGTVFDPSGAVLPGATVQAGEGIAATTDAQGKYQLPCVPAGATISAKAEGFQVAISKVRAKGAAAHLDLHLLMAVVETSVVVNTSDTGDLDTGKGMGSQTLLTKDVLKMADDPDDFRRQLQVLAAANGGIPGQARITVDGFQNSSALPPKSSIARVVTAPDMFSSEYDTPPYEGSRVEIYTRPGQASVHGAVFYSNSNRHLNATDPFSAQSTATGKQRYGLEMTGPIVKARCDYSLSLEKRDLDEFNIVNAISLDSQMEPAALHQTVSAPQRLWIGSARLDLNASASDEVSLSFSANTNDLDNQGIGGSVTTTAGYNSQVSEYNLRLSNTQTLHASTLHETHFGITWKDTRLSPFSSDPGLMVAGFFQAGGSPAQGQDNNVRNLEVDDSILYTHGRHTWKFGLQTLGAFVQDLDPDTFNGLFVFGGGTAPQLDSNGVATGQSILINGLEQYRRTLLNLPGGTPSTYSATTGTAMVSFTRWQMALYAEDSVKISPRLTLSGGLRYALQTAPSSDFNFAPRTGLAWAMNHHRTMVLNLHAGIFSSVLPLQIPTESYRLSANHQVGSLVYLPSFANPLVPTAQSVKVTSMRTLPASLPQVSSFQSGVGIERDFPHHWRVQSSWYHIAAWDFIRSRNINAPLLPSSYTAPDPAAAAAGPRPLGANLNIFRYEATSHVRGDVLFLGLDQHNYKRFGFFAGNILYRFRGDGSNDLGCAQSAYSNQGESSRPDWQPRDHFFLLGDLSLPYKVALSTEMDAQTGLPYNITTGIDANGDGVENQRPSYAPAPGDGVYSTHFGLLTVNTINGNVPRNLGTMPTLLHLDMNLSRSWAIGAGSADKQRSFTLNLRSANLLNHTNVTAVGTVVSSPNFSQPQAAEASRRVEFGARLAF